MAMNDDEIARRKGLTFAQAVPAADAIEEDGGNAPRILPDGRPRTLRLAVIELTNGNFADSVRESIHSIESVVRVLEPSGDFSKALSKLEQKTDIHAAMKKGFLALYGFSSDEQGFATLYWKKKHHRWTKPTQSS